MDSSDPSLPQIAVLGCKGQLGSELCRRLGERAIGLERAALDVTDRRRVLEALEVLRPSTVINTAAYTFVDKAEGDQAACRALNVDAVASLAEVCRRTNSTLVHISTDYVFGADTARRTPYREADPPSPQSIYAQTKLEGEGHAATCPRHFILRTCGLFGRRTAGSGAGNFVETMLRLAQQRDTLRVVDDQHCTPTYVPHLATALLFLVESERYGTYHVVNRGATTWHGFATEIFRQSGIDIKLERITTAQFAAPAPRPLYSVLDTTKYHALGGPPMPSWQQGLSEYLAERSLWK